MKLILNEVLRDDLRAKLEDEARERDITLNDVAGEILAARYGLTWRMTGAAYTSVATRFKLRVPEPLHKKIRQEYARDSSKTVRGIVLSVLAQHYDIEPIYPHRRRRSST